MEKGLVIGIALEETAVQACIYDFRLRAPKTLRFSLEKSVFSRKAGLGMDGKDSGYEPDIDALHAGIRAIINEAFRQTGFNKLKSLCLLYDCSDYDRLNAVRTALTDLSIPNESWQVIGKMEGFAYYAYSQRKELYASGVVLMDYGTDGLLVSRLDFKRKDGMDYVIEESTRLDTESVLAAARGDKSLDEVSAELCSYTESYFDKRTASAVYLTGKGFDVESLPVDFSRVIINKRKAYVGQNLYVKGACFAALEQLEPNVFDRVVLLMDGRIKVGIEIDIWEHGQLRTFRIMRAGTNWFMADRTMDFILDDVRQIVLKIVTLDKTYSEEVIDISEIPYREGKTTRITMQVKFLAQDRCMVMIKDKGFGDFFKSSGKVIYKELTFE